MQGSALVFVLQQEATTRTLQGNSRNHSILEYFIFLISEFHSNPKSAILSTAREEISVLICKIER